MMKEIALFCALVAFVFARESLSNFSIDVLKQGFGALDNYCRGKSLDFCSLESIVFAKAYLQSQIDQKEKEKERERYEARKEEEMRQQHRKNNQLMFQKLRQKQHFIDRHF